MKGKLDCGFEYEVNEKALESFEFMEILNEAVDNPVRYIKAFELILGKDQKNKLMEYFKEDGYTNSDKMTNALLEIIEKTSALKNSQSSVE